MSTVPRNLVELAEGSFQRYRDRPLFGTKTATGRTWTTYGEVSAAVDALRAGLAGLGVRAGDRVAIVAANRIEWAVAAYATYGLGAAFVAMYEQQRSKEWEHILGDCGAKVVIGSTPHVVAALEEMRPRLPSLTHLVAIDAPKDGTSTFEGVLERGRANPVPAISPEPDALATLIYTSGTTGLPKGVMLSHANVTSNIATTIAIFPFTPDDRMLSFLPWAHAYGQTELNVVLAAGASAALCTDVKNLVEELAEVRPTILVAVPRIWNRLYASVTKQVAERPKVVQSLFRRAVRTAARRLRNEPTSAMDRLALRLADRLIFSKVRERFGGRLKYAISASATLSVDVAEAIDAMGIEVYEAYGLTEASPLVTGNLPDPGGRKFGSVGRAIPGVRVVIDESVGDWPNRGEIVVYGPNVMRGYFGRTEETAKALTADGGLRTGDIGYLDENGFLYITGRIKEQYKLENGEYVMPSPLEEALKLSPYILNVMLYGDNRPYNVALVVLNVDAVRAWAKQRGLTLARDLTTDPNVKKLVEGDLARFAESFRGYERPQAFGLITEDFTIESGLLTPTMKLKRREAIARFGEALDALYRQPRPQAALGGGNRVA
ncbi:MAG TPA: long-chain fatty acid--CoA ligase [Polyangiaceae bacterium]|nr:long-chain fatty acid--CoA ligase [Polyangiaceae bacterium]